jgi:hypothetical protein
MNPRIFHQNSIVQTSSVNKYIIFSILGTDQSDMPIDVSRRLIHQDVKTYGTHEPTSPRWNIDRDTPDYTKEIVEDNVDTAFPTEEERILKIQEKSWFLSKVWAVIIFQLILVTAAISVIFYVPQVAQFHTTYYWVGFIYLGCVVFFHCLCLVLYRIPIVNLCSAMMLSISVGAALGVLCLRLKFMMILVPLISLTVVMSVAMILGFISQIIALHVVTLIVGGIFFVILIPTMIGIASVMMFYLQIGIWWQYLIGFVVGGLYWGLFIVESVYVVHHYDSFWEFSSAGVLIHSKGYLFFMIGNLFCCFVKNGCKKAPEEI